MLIALKAKLLAAGTVVLTVIAFILRFQSLKNSNERLKRQADTMKARSVQEQAQKRIAKREKLKLVSRKADLVKELNKDKEEFEGLKNLSDPNDF